MSGQSWPSRLTGNSRGCGAGPNLNVVSGRQPVQGLPNLPPPPQSVYTIYSSTDEEDQVASSSTSNTPPASTIASSDNVMPGPSSAATASSAQGQAEADGALGPVDVFDWKNMSAEEIGNRETSDAASSSLGSSDYTANDGTDEEVAGSTPDYTPRSPSPTPRQAEGGSGTASENGSEEWAPASPSGGPSNQAAPPSFPRQESQDGRWNDRRQSTGRNWATRSRPFDRHLNRTGTRGRATAPARYQPYYENRQVTPHHRQNPTWSADHHYHGSQRYREGYRQDSRSGERGSRESRDRERRGSGDRERDRRSRSGEPVHRGSRELQRRGSGQREQWDRRGSGERGQWPRGRGGWRGRSERRAGEDRQERRGHSSHHHDERHRQRNSRRSPPRPGTSHGAHTASRKMETVKLPAREIINLIRTCREPGCGNRVFPTRRQAVLHLKKDHNKELCILCFQTFSTMGVEHLTHFLSAHADDKKETAECPMEGCRRSFTSWGMYGHLSKCHLVPEEKDE